MFKHTFHSNRLARDTQAITALEYGIAASLIGITLLGIFTNYGATVASLFTTISTSL